MADETHRQLSPDSDGQPRALEHNWNRRRDSRTDELIGLCRGVLADGVFVTEEAQYLLDWLGRNVPVSGTLAGKRLHGVLQDALRDGHMDVDEERQLIELLMAVIGGTPHTDDASYTCSLPLDDPPPAVTFPGQSFCFTGKFRFGTRAQCQEAVERLGAIVHDRPTMDTCYLVLGEIGSRDWVHSTHGRKIERAVELREEGRAIHIISEVQWVLHLPTKV